MPFLIDGHNLIDALPDISLEDPHDEVALILKLRGWLAHQRKKAVVIFDGGIPGGYSRTLSSSDLEVIFAAYKRSNADRILMKRLTQLRDPANWTIVTSDREILDFARRIGARALSSPEFAALLTPAETQPAEKPREPSTAEVRAWLEVFPEPPDTSPATPPHRPRPIKPPTTTPELTSPPQGQTVPPQRSTPHPSALPTPTLAERLGIPLEPEAPSATSLPAEKPAEISPEEVAEWLEVFHDVPEGPRPPQRRLREPSPRQPPATPAGRKELTVHKEVEETLPPEEVEAWLTLFPEATVETAATETPASPPLPAKYRRPKAFRAPKLRRHQQRTPPLPAAEEDAPGLTPEEREQWFRLYGEEPD